MSFLLGPIGSIVAIPLEKFLSELVRFGIVSIDTMMIKRRVTFEEKELDSTMKKVLKNIKDKHLTEEEKRKVRDEVMAVASRFASLKRL